MTITILSDSICKARKIHTCDECLSPIHEGELYHKQVNIFCGDFGVWKSHPKCGELSIYMNRDSYEGEWAPLHEFSQLDKELALRELESVMRQSPKEKG